MLDKYITINNQKLRYGYTTGACAAAASKAAVLMLCSGRKMDSVSIDTPKGWRLDVPLIDVVLWENALYCAVIKDSGDDPDVTHGIKIAAKAEWTDQDEIMITGGKGVGTVTKKGLLVEPGQPAINPGPRAMIIQEVSQVKPPGKGVLIEISVPGGEKIAQKTFNPKLGIKGGISILGTTGIVEPKSEEAYKQSIRLELSVLKNSASHLKKTDDCHQVILTPGNYGQKFLLEHYSGMEKYIVHMGNYVGPVLEYTVELGFNNVLIAGHFSKLIKIAGGNFNTHSRVSDSRLEIMSANYNYYYGDSHLAKQIMDANSIEDAVQLIYKRDFFKIMADKIKKKCLEYVQDAVSIEVLVFSFEKGLLAKTEDFDSIMKQF
jgi:cobalt-precorrin-5B (C1)-methyltransferase